MDVGLHFEQSVSYQTANSSFVAGEFSYTLKDRLSIVNFSLFRAFKDTGTILGYLSMFLWYHVIVDYVNYSQPSLIKVNIKSKIPLGFGE